MDFMDIEKVLDNFSKVKIAVVGDVMLDSYIYGSVDRISPEAPVLILKANEEVYELGGAANVAKNIVSLGGNVTLFGYVGKDSAKDILFKKLNEENVGFQLFDVLEKTTQKIRLMGDRQHQMLRLDKESYAKALEDIEERLAKGVCDKNPDIIIFSDYAKGCLTGSLFSKIKKYNPETKIIVDPKPKNKENYYDVYLITPNSKEAEEMSQLDSGNIDNIGKYLKNKFRSNILITKGKEGMSLFEGDKIINFPTQAREIYDVTGAGDTVVAIISLCIASGLSLEDSAYLANHGAGIVVGKAGTATVSQNELKQTIESENKKLKDLYDLKKIREDYRKKGKKVIWTNGCFDILHAGHVDYLRKARKLGDCLFVGLNSDDSARKLKGEGRPINNEKHRAEVLSSLGFVDYVIIFNELTVENCLKELKPDVYVKAGDYDINKMDQDERKVIESYGGGFAFIPIIYNLSTTKIIDKIKDKT